MTFNINDVVAERERHERLLRSWHDHATSCGKVVGIDRGQGVVAVEYLDGVRWISAELLERVA